MMPERLPAPPRKTLLMRISSPDLTSVQHEAHQSWMAAFVTVT
jgi:hypothetical protein